MILSEDIVRQVLSGKRTMVRLPIKTRPCQYKEGRAYAVKTATRAPISCHITIANVTEALIDDQNVWVIRFFKGDHTDKPRLLKARPGGEQYTHVPALALRHELEAVSDQLLARYATIGRERHADTLADQKRRLQVVLGEIRRHATDPAVNAKLRLAQQRVRQIRPDDVIYDHAARADHRAPERDSGC